MGANVARSRELVTIAGCTGSGKTTLAGGILRTRGPTTRMLVFDPLGDLPSSLAAQVCERVYRDPRALRAEVLKRGVGAPWRFGLVPPAGEKSEALAADFLAALALYCGDQARGGADLWLVLEEAGRAANVKVCPPNVLLVAQRGRHVGVSLMTCSQRPVSIAPDVRAELAAGEAWVGRLLDWNDKKNVRTQRGPVYAERVGTLETVQQNKWSRWLRFLPGEPVAEEWSLRFKRNRPEFTKIEGPAAQKAAK